MNEVDMVANLLFSETKDSKDAEGIASVIGNRVKRPERFGATIQDVMFAPKQFSGVGGKEWNKAVNKKFTKEDEGIYKDFLRIANQLVTGKLKDTTGGADHYVNLSIAQPKFSKVYSKTGKIGEHTYYSEKPVKQSKADNASFSDTFSEARKAGKKEFTWKGNRYNTKQAGE